MIELLNSNFQPLKTSSKKFSDIFFDLFVNKASSTRIASGYVSEESTADLINLYETGYCKPLNLVVGMHYFEGFSYGQYYALLRLADILAVKNIGSIYVSTVMKYHGKLYSFCENGQYSAIIGSSNLTKIALAKETAAERVYDTDLYIRDETVTADIECKTSGDYSKNFRSASDLKILGRWIKGRMENRRVLKIGEKATEITLANYGRNSIRLIKTKMPNTWYLDFKGCK